MVNDGDYLYLLGSFKAEKYESVGMMTFPTEWKKRNIPNHQPEMVCNGKSY